MKRWFLIPKHPLSLSHSRHSLQGYANLIAGSALTQRDQACGAVSMYARLPSTFMYLACVLGAWSRRCIGWQLSRTIGTQLTLAALNQPRSLQWCFKISLLLVLFCSEMGNQLAEVAHLHFHVVLDFKSDCCLWNMLRYCGVEGLEVNRSAPDRPMLVASAIVVVQMNMAQPIIHPSHPFKCIQFGKHVLMPDVHAKAQKGIADFVYKADKYVW
jgi:hypothetical protein